MKKLYRIYYITWDGVKKYGDPGTLDRCKAVINIANSTGDKTKYFIEPFANHQQSQSKEGHK